MMKITALNEDIQPDENNENEIQVTKEAEETIAVSEYMRALKLKADGKKENALILFSELLETRVINETSLEDKNDKLFSVRYNCHKNIALIYEEQGKFEDALPHFVSAMELDDTEVYAMYKLGQLALKLEKWNLAEVAFQKCLAKNPNHWPSADGMLQVFCSTENILAAYGWAMRWYRKDENYERAVDVLTEITEKFKPMIPFCEGVWRCSFKGVPDSPRKNKKSVFPVHENSIEAVIEKPVKPNLDEFRVDELSWQSVGQFMVSIYEYLQETNQSILFLLTLDDIRKEHVKEYIEDPVEFVNEAKENITDVPELDAENNPEVKNEDSKAEENPVFLAPSVENVGSQTPLQSDSNAEDSDNPKIETEVAKPKARRRCSDLSFLEQWGWHKNRRYSSRKKSQQDQQVDTTINGFLKRILSKFFEKNFDGQSPFLQDRSVEMDINKKKEQMKAKYEEIQVSYEEFHSKTQGDFQKFLEELKSQNFDLILMVFLWLKYISKYWDQSITENIKELYHKIYGYYLNHYDLNGWNLLSNDDFNAVFRMTLFFMEIDLEKSIINSKTQHSDVDEKWRMLFHHLMFNSGNALIIADELYERNIIRLVWQDYCSAKFENDLNRSVECLLQLEFLLEKQENGFKLELPNLRENNFIHMDGVKVTRVDLQRKISLNNVKNLYDSKKFADLVTILKDSLINSTEIKNSDNTVMKIQTQFEVLLEALWNLDKREECLIWSERCLKHAVDNLLAAPTDTYRYKEWAESVNYILIYVEELILQNTHEILSSLEKYESRLVQSLSKILVHQFDGTFDKNNNPPHPVNAKRSWVILHQVLQRIEDNSPVVIKTKNVDGTEPEDIEELLPHTLLILFNAHEILGRRFWCTRDNGQFLLYILNVVAPKIRAPYMDSYRDLVAEYVEQITYCLYGYPPKKARSRHIEEHDAVPVELTWERSITLFDLYRPENLPEFNSYKLESISADMEQLLLKILPLIPKEIDPNSLTSHIKEYISGTKDELPKECCLLPHRISCIYYLLADYYFKNRDFLKTIKFYILDLTIDPFRFDSWAGLALSKASKLETKLNSCILLDLKEFLMQAEDAIKCFEQCIKLNREHTLLWIEYGSFAYTIHSFCSRNLKHDADTLSMEKFAFVEGRKEQYLKIAYDCFTIADKTIKTQPADVKRDESDSHDEKWLHHFMLGKIAEKRKEHPKVFLDHYLLASNYLYENNATYPIKINHNNPSTLSIEALELFYRTTSAIIKYLEQHDELNREIGRLFTQVLKTLAGSPFAYNQAKIDDNSINALKRKLAAEKAAGATNNKQIKTETTQESAESSTKVESEKVVADNSESEKSKPTFPTPVSAAPVQASSSSVPAQASSSVPVTDEKTAPARPETSTNVASKSKSTSPLRRGSQESTVTASSSTGTGTTSSTSSSSGSDSSSSDSSSSDSESESSEEEAEKVDENSPLKESELEPIYKSCIKNLEECVTRFPEHYKSIYRLVNHYLNGVEKLRDLQKCRQLLLGTYTTSLGNQIQGLFADRKNNNFFNGIWRIPSSEIDRPGSFASHLVKCVVILLEVLRKTGDHKTLIDLALQLHRNPDNDKRYIKDSERKELYQQAMSFCIQVMRDILKKNLEKRDDVELLNLLIDIYKAHKKCLKHMNQKEIMFTQLLTDAYRFYIQDKVARIPENTSMLDLAIKLCLQEISFRKNREKLAQQEAQGITLLQNVPVPGGTSIEPQIPMIPKTANIPITTANVTKPVQIPGISSRPRGRPVGSKNSNTTNMINMQPMPQMGVPGLGSLFDQTTMSALMSIYSNPALASGLAKDPACFQTFMAEYYKILSGSNLATSGLTNSTLQNLTNPALNPLLPNPLKQAMAQQNKPSTSTIPSATGTGNQPAKIPQFDIKNLIASAASQVAKSTNLNLSQSATISIGSGQLTITPTTSKSSIPSSSSLTITQSGPKSSNSSTSISLTKLPTGSPGLSVKPLSELTGSNMPFASTSSKSQPAQIPNLPELPKSLTITPAPSTSQMEKSKSLQSQIPQVSVLPEPKLETQKFSGNVGKIKPSKKSPNPSPYVRTQSPNIASFSGASGVSSTPTPPPAVGGIPNLPPSVLQQFPLMGNFNLQNYNKQVNLLNTYAELIKSMGMTTNPAVLTQISQLQQFQAPQPQKRPYTKRTRAPKTQPRFPAPTSSTSSSMSMGGNLSQMGGLSAGTTSSMSVSTGMSMIAPHQTKSKSATNQQFVAPFNVPPSKSPSSGGSVGTPTISPNPSPGLSLPFVPPPGTSITRQSITPPGGVSVVGSPTKTLQQKLAEKQKANAMNENSGRGSSGSGGSAGGSSSQSKRKDSPDVIVLD